MDEKFQRERNAGGVSDAADQGVLVSTINSHPRVRYRDIWMVNRAPNFHIEAKVHNQHQPPP
jgi:hypothetical protein